MRRSAGWGCRRRASGGGWNLTSQLIQDHGGVSQVKWGTVGANAAGGFVAGGLAGATGGLSLLAEGAVGGTLAVDVAIGGVSNVAGGITTRGLDPNDQSDDTWDVGEVSKDALSGFVGGGVGHIAAALTHEPIDLGRGPRKGTRKIRAFNQAVRHENNLRNLSLGVGTAAGSPPTHATNWFMNNFWDSLNWLVMGPQTQPCARTSATDSQGNTTGWSGCQ